MNKNDIIKLINSLIEELPRADSVINKLKELNLWETVISDIDNNLLSTDMPMEKLYVYINGYSSCPQNNKKTFRYFAKGYQFCQNTCKCKIAFNAFIKNQQTVEKRKHEYTEYISKFDLDLNSIKTISKDKIIEIINILLIDHKCDFVINKLKYMDLWQFVLNDIKDKNLATENEQEKVYVYLNGEDTDPCDQNKKKFKEFNTGYQYCDNKTINCPCMAKYHNARISKTKQSYSIFKKTEVKNKRIKTCNDRYGVDHNMQHQPTIDKTTSTNKKFYYDKLCARLEECNVKPLANVNEYTNVDTERTWLCTVCNSIFNGYAYDGRVPRCSTCYPLEIASAAEIEVKTYIESLIGADLVIGTDTKTIAPKHLDIHIPSHNIAIEFNGVFWHTDRFLNKDSKYHYKKWFECNKQGIQLISIWSDEWKNKQDLIKSMISARLGISNKIYARNTKIKEIENDIARDFYNKNHINGFVNSKYHYGLYHNKNLVMCMSFSKPRFSSIAEYEITRMATEQYTTVVGGASKLFKNFIKNVNPSSVLSYCDLRFGTGNVYLQLGFETYKEPTIGFQYVHNGRPGIRINRQKLQKHKLGDIGDKTATNYLSENGYNKLWDCGHQKFLWIKSSIQ